MAVLQEIYKQANMQAGKQGERCTNTSIQAYTAAIQTDEKLVQYTPRTNDEVMVGTKQLEANTQIDTHTEA